MEVSGTIKLIKEKVEFDSGFVKRAFVLTTDDKYPQDLEIEFMKEKVSELDKFSEGDAVEVAINLRGREYQGKYYTNITGWKISLLKSANERTKDVEAQTETRKNLELETKPELSDDLPF
jgi:hypothetical protein